MGILSPFTGGALFALRLAGVGMGRKRGGPRRTHVGATAPALALPSPPSRRTSRIELGLAIAAALVLITTVWLVPRDTSDTYVALAGARDLHEGKLGAPDDWAFTTAGRVWINQNWGTGVLFDAAWRSAGEKGLLAVKAGLLATLVVLLALVGRVRGASWSTGLLVGGGVLVAARSYVDLRPNLLGFTLAASMILTLALARRNVPWIWASVAVSTLWANTHGSFIFGLGMMGLWTVCALLASLAEHGPAEAARRFWPLPAATLAATLLAGTVTPFGLENLIHPFTVARHPIWRRVTEWWPIFQAGENPFGSLWEFFTFLAVLAVLVGIHAFRRAGSPRRTRRRWAPSDLAGIAFDAALSIVVIAMAFGARRFIPQAMVVVAPVVMVLLDPILRIRPVWPTALLAVALAGPTAVVCARLVPHYLAGNPLYAHEDRSFFARMIRQELFPSDLAEFVRANGIEGRVLNEWRWEGYLRWQVPRLKLYVGGRAQQVYAPETYRLWLDLLEGRAPTAVLPRSEVALVIGPTRGPFRKLLDRLVHEPEPRWVYVYCDTRGAVLADVRSDATRALVEKSRSGALTYPDPSIGRISRAMFLSSPAAGAPPQQAVLSLLAAGRERPTPILYEALVKLAQSGSVSPQWVLEQLEAERTRLASLPAGQGDYVKILSSRSLIDQLLAQVYRASSDPAERQRSSDLLEEARGLSEEVRRVTVKE